MNKRFARFVFFTALLMILTCAGFCSVYAETETGASDPAWTLVEGTEISISSYLTEYYLTIANIGDYDADSFEITSSDESIVTVEDVFDQDGFVVCTVQKRDVGNAAINITDPQGLCRTCGITAEPLAITMTDKVSFNKKNAYVDFIDIFPEGEYDYDSDTYYDDDIRIKGVKASVKSVVKATVQNDSYSSGVRIVPKKAGKTVLTITDNYGRTKKITVTVAKNYFASNLKENTYANIYYGRSKAEVYSKPKAKVTVEIGGKKYTERTNKNGRAVIRLKRSDYKLNTKATVTVRYKGMTVKKKDQVSSHTWSSFGQVWSCEKEVPVTVYNVTKGDKVILEAGSKKYRKKITSKADKTYLTFYTDYDLENYSTLRLIVKNKYGQKLADRTWTLTWGY